MSNPFAPGASPTPIIPVGMTQAEFDSQTRVPEVLYGSIVPFGLATLFVLARFYSRLILTRSWAQDDAWISISWLGALVLTILNCLFTLYGTGRHVTVQKPQYLTPSLKVSYCVRCVYVLVLATTKIAVLTLYRRVFGDKKTKHIIWGMMALVVLYTIPVLMMFLFQCRPIYGVWQSSIQKTCLNTDMIVYISSGFNIAVDIALVVVAMPRILPLILPPTQKAALIAVSSLSILVVISAIIRLVRVTALSSSIDYSWDAYDVTTWTAVEVNVGLFCAAAPAIRPLIRAVTGAFASNPSTNSNYPRHGTYGTGTRSRAIELDDSEGFNATRTKNTFWTKSKTELSDGDSTKGVLDQRQGAEGGGITRTVVISVNVDSERIDTDSERDDDERGGVSRQGARESGGKRGSSEYL